MLGRPTDMARRLGVAALLGSLAPVGPGVACADHDMAMSDRHGDASEFSVGVSLEAAEFDNETYVGSYQGITPVVAWMDGRFGARATLGLYHLTENGLSLYGPGDATFAAHATVLATETVQTGVALHVMAPTGSELHGFGMGHVMAMPSAWATWHPDAFAVSATAGYARALTSLGGAHHAHGRLPFVDPMNPQELTWSAGADLAVGRGVRVGCRSLGAVPIGAGITRVIGAGRVAWGTSRVSTAFELQLGLVGDPFTIRGVVDTALRF